MKKILFIPAVCLLCFACTSHDRDKYGSKNQHEESSPDWEITTKVKAAILANSSIGASARFVSVTTNNGVVTLTGHVSCSEDRSKIAKIAKKVHGVKGVDNQITISK